MIKYLAIGILVKTMVTQNPICVSHLSFNAVKLSGFKRHTLYFYAKNAEVADKIMETIHTTQR